MDLLPHGNDFGLANGWVKCILHFFLKLDFTFPEENLALCLHDLAENVAFLILEVGDFHLQPD